MPISARRKKKLVADWVADQERASPVHRELMLKTEYVIDASYEESHQLWYKYHHHWGVPWRQESMGLIRQIGWGSVLGEELRIAAEVYWAQVGPAWVAFVGSSSRLVDHSMLEEWCRAVFPCMAHFGRHTNATNFGNAVRDIGDRHKVRLFDDEKINRAENYHQ
jgi:hypothetical protein